MSAFDQLGFVSLDDVQNVFITEIKKLEEDYKRQGVPTNPRVVFETLDAIRMTLMKRAKDNVKNYLLNNPHVRKEMREVKDARDQNVAQKSWKQRVQESREKAMRLGLND